MRLLSSKVMGIFRVSGANLIALVLSMLTSFVLPLFISVEEYGFWQLFVLYSGYTGFFVLGFNDGIQLNYATFCYDENLAAKFRTFKGFLCSITLIESVLLLIALFFVFDTKSFNFYIALFVILNILPTAIIGLFTYMNQSTLRFKQYSVGNIIDKILFAIFMILLMVFRSKTSLTYIAAYTVSRYCVIIYHYYSSREVFTIKAAKINELKYEILANFRNGFPLMIAVILGGPSIIVGSRFLVEAKFGVEAFSAYSFSLHTLIIASQFISAVATVFYPILKRCTQEELGKMYGAFDKMASLAAALLLLSYYPAALLIKSIYSRYAVILTYLYIIYPLFLYQCKSNVLVTNMYKVKNQPIRLIEVNAVGILIHVFCVYLAYVIWQSVVAISAATLIAYSIWYYIYQLHTYKKEKWPIQSHVFRDLPIILVFIFVNLITMIIWGEGYLSIILSFAVYSGLLLLAYLVMRTQIRRDIRDFIKIMQD